MIPSRSSSRYARLTVMTLTWVEIARARMEGISCPGGHSPMATRRLICSMIWRYIGRRSAWEMVTGLCILDMHSMLNLEVRQAAGKSREFCGAAAVYQRTDFGGTALDGPARAMLGR